MDTRSTARDTMGHKKAFFRVGVKRQQLLICCPQPPLVRYRIDHPPAETAAMSGILHASICCHSLLGQPRAHETGDHPYAAQDRAVSHPRADRRTKLSAAIAHAPGHPARRGRRKGDGNWDPYHRGSRQGHPAMPCQCHRPLRIAGPRCGSDEAKGDLLIQREAGHAKKTLDKALDGSCTVVPRASYKRSF